MKNFTEKYEKSVSALLSFCQHYGYDDDDDDVVSEYIEFCKTQGIPICESIEKSLKLNLDRTGIELIYNFKAMVLLRTSNLIHDSISENIKKTISENIFFHPIFANNSSRISINTKNLKIVKVPFTPIYTIKGLIGFSVNTTYQENENDTDHTTVLKSNLNSLISTRKNKKTKYKMKIMDLSLLDYDIYIDTTAN